MEVNIEELFNNPKLLFELDSFTVYKIIGESLRNANIKKFLIENINIVVNRITLDFNFFDVMSLYCLVLISDFKDIIEDIINRTLNKIFNKETIFFIRLMNKKIQASQMFDVAQIYDLIFFTIQSYSSEKASILLYNLYLLPDFKIELEKRFNIVGILLEKYQKFDQDSIIKNAFKGSSIIGCLIKDDNESLVISFIEALLRQYNTCLEKTTCIGGGSTCLVYRIGNSVIKLGETRNQRKIFVNHRILASQIRKLVSKDGIDLFYVEVMKYIQTGDVTKDECDELSESLLRQGLIWEDAKPENCGVLDNDDENISNLPVDYVEIAGVVNNPCEREQFMKRKRRVVVLDNDNIRRNPKSLWK